MITIEQFRTVINNRKKQHDKLQQLYKLGIELTDYSDVYDESISVLFSSLFGKDGLDMIDWFCFDNKFGEGHFVVTDKKGNVIHYNIDSLYEYLTLNLGWHYLKDKPNDGQFVILNTNDNLIYQFNKNVGYFYSEYADKYIKTNEVIAWKPIDKYCHQ